MVAAAGFAAVGATRQAGLSNKAGWSADYMDAALSETQAAILEYASSESKGDVRVMESAVMTPIDRWSFGALRDWKAAVCKNDTLPT